MTCEPHPRWENIIEDGMTPLYLFSPPVKTDWNGTGFNGPRFREEWTIILRRNMTWVSSSISSEMGPNGTV